MKGAPAQIGFVLRILDFCKINPFKQNNFTRIYQFVAILFSVYLVMLHILELTINFNGVQTVEKMRFTPCILIKNYQYVFYALATKKIKAPFDALENLWPWDKFGTGIGKKMQVISDQWYFFIRFYFWLIVINVSVMILEPYLRVELVFPSYDYCDMANNTICFHINFLISSIQLVFIYVPTVFAFDLYFLAFCAQAYIQFELLKIALRECQVGMDNRASIKAIVDQHNVITSFVKEMDSWMSNLFLVKYMGFMFQMISALYMLTINGMPPSLMDMKTYGLHFLTVMLMIYMYCYGAAAIYDQSLSVADAAWTMRWDEKGQTSLRKDVAFIILRAQRPELFTAGYFPLNMDAFVAAMQNTFSVYGLLATLAADEIMARQISKEIIRT